MLREVKSHLIELCLHQLLKMKIEIWSDIACPFCYIGKRHFEKALASLELENDVIVEWKSFQLNPDQRSQPGKTIDQYLAEVKGISESRANELNAHVTSMAAMAGLEFHMDKIIVANSGKAHEVIQFAKTKNLGDEAEEFFFRAYFCEGADISDENSLINAGKAIGLDSVQLTVALHTDSFKSNVEDDIREAAELGIRGVPFFVINRKYGISGAQPVEVFKETLKGAMQEEMAS